LNRDPGVIDLGEPQLSGEFHAQILGFCLAAVLATAVKIPLPREMSRAIRCRH
jgi:hypothetical protein